jgi:hypothetical protein
LISYLPAAHTVEQEGETGGALRSAEENLGEKGEKILFDNHKKR